MTLGCARHVSLHAQITLLMLRLQWVEYLKGQPRLHLFGQNLSDTAIKVGENLHGQLRLDAPLADQVIEGVR
jgi:hypothetical protein